MYNLLIVDDEPLTREFIKNQISEIDPDWVAAGEAQDGLQALEFLDNHHVDLVITDIKMPLMGGLELCEKIKLKNPLQEIAILSGYDEFSFAQEALKYHVRGYLLKPIKIPPLKELLADVSRSIISKRKQDVVLETLQNISTDYTSHIIRSYLRAIIGNHHTEIKSLHPLVYNLKIDLIQSCGIILVLKLDISSVFINRLPVENLTLYHYILFQSATETVNAENSGYVVLDSEDNTVIYLSGDRTEELIQKCSDTYIKISSFLKVHIGLTVSGFIGTAKSEILDMYLSYTDALKNFDLCILKGNNALYGSSIVEQLVLDSIGNIQKLCSAIINGVAIGHDANIHIAVKDYVLYIGELNQIKIIDFLLLLLDKIRKIKFDFSTDQYISCVYEINNFITCQQKNFNQDEIVQFYINVINRAWDKKTNPHEDVGTQKLVEDSKNYIYTHFSEPITLSQIAESLDVSPNYLSKIFHETVGESYIKFITRIRMEYAAKLLRENPNARIFVVAQKTGYYNLKHFNFVFKEFYNMTPTEYQNL